MFAVDMENPIGSVVGAYVAKPAKDFGGGAVTSILLYLLENGRVDGVVTARKVKGLTGEILLIRTVDELLKTAGNIWSVVPYTMKLKEMLSSSDVRKVAFVGLPCQAQFLRQMKMFPLTESDFASKIHVIISLFCMGTFAVESFASYLSKSHKISLEDVENIDVDGEHLVITYPGGELRLAIDLVLSHIQHGCLLCPDYTGVFADISAGRVRGETLLITRNKFGDNIVRKAAEKGYLEIEEAFEELEVAMLKAKEKVERSIRYLTRLL